MIKYYIFFILFILGYTTIFSQWSGFSPISETYSSNGIYKLKSISYDDFIPNLKGESIIFFNRERDSLRQNKVYYKLNRSFDLDENFPFFLAISNDGRKIIYFTNYINSQNIEERNVTYYIDGKIAKTYSSEEFTNCDKNKEKCRLFYETENRNLFENYTSTYKEYNRSLSEKDVFLTKNFIFNKNDTIYLIDNRKQVTLFDLDKGEIIKSNIDFDSIYTTIKNIETIKSKITSYEYPYKYIIDVKNSLTNEKISESISKLSNLKFIPLEDSTYNKYKLHRIDLSGYLNRNGKFEIQNLKTDSIFNKQQIENYLLNSTFETDFIPKEVDKIYITNFFGGYRNYDDKIAELETIKDKEKRRIEREKRLTLEKIDNIYIPKNLYESLTELDKILDFEAKKELKESTDTFMFNSHMGGLGMWIRNKWGINGGSRLSKYFNDRNTGKQMFGNDVISGLIIKQYILWLKGDKTSWKKWEEENPVK
ncbi:DUF6794 domain-containing protein [uncultured Empedobacter sp.]|uniref:DUF6794 domain-containing protein n=1 Tax=uncultured Empedobacter sp. TaxID=410844 RepID=UPI002639CD10|nr:DUF6794 domain-containing protein [uncultured Empedobacter sp.]